MNTNECDHATPPGRRSRRNFLFKAAAQAVRGSAAFKAQLMRQLHEAAATNPDPNAQRAIEQLSTPEGITIVLAVVVVMMLVSFIIFGIIGGAVGASIWGKRQTT